MNLHSILHDAVVSIQALKAADDEALTGAGVDMQGKKGVAFLVMALKGEALAFSIKAQQDSASDFGTAADLAGTAVAFSTAIGTDAMTILEIKDPQERYVRPVITVPDAAAATPVACFAVVYGGDVLPESNSGELHIGPSEGTA